MRIVVVNNFFPPRVGGSAHMAAALAGKYAEAGHDVLVLTAAYGQAPAEEERDGYRIIRLPAVRMPILGLSIDFDLSFAAMVPGNRRRIRRLLHEFQPDALHLHGQFFDLSWLAGCYGRRLGVPSIVTIHTLLVSENPWYGAIFRALDAVLVKPMLRRIGPLHILLDKLGADYCARRYGTTAANSVHLPIPIDTGFFDRADVRTGEREGASILSLGHVIPLRNRLPLVEALPSILAKHPGTTVTVVGRVYHDEFLRRAEELGVRDAIVVRGAVPREEVPSYFAAADVVAHDLNGGCGTASLEAMLSGTATIASVAPDNYPGVELRNGENILLVPPDDPGAVAEAVIGLLDDPRWRADLARRASALVREHFALDVVAKHHLRLLEALCSSTTSAATGSGRRS
ncbi:glycosyltransferase family 4 protein [Amycolatopsis alkalitolerans]|uniref:Glycosyltransferase family 4 protein n=1 Tax=Amycolatopsis alkalitolerans TaxID=2547244 RepID=A0A5C4M565_9PSEU|nr:glycosyltransferase family 4 protein [Amycolatopsis alkalitolerans]TNC27422.1 glycosyltransferase family 4 protein [Amycolatopsis alkalitolerans]